MIGGVAANRGLQALNSSQDIVGSLLRNPNSGAALAAPATTPVVAGDISNLLRKK
jgi:hypothetical protein